VTLDTTRADRIGSYGYPMALTPALDALAGDGLRFERAYAVVPLTTPAHASILTGLYPTRHGVHTNGDAILPEQAQTLAEILKEEGYRTAASVSAFVTTRVWNLDQGFEAYYDQVRGDEDQPENRWMRERAANEVADDAIAWLKERGTEQEPFFLWAHFYDPHRPLEAPKEWLEAAGERPYDAEIAFMDHELGRIIEAAQLAAGDDGAHIIAVADHGEALRGEHGETDHGLFLFDPTTRVPFIIRPAQALEAPLVEKRLAVSNTDVMPTALGLLGVQVPADLDGHDLSPLLRGESVERPPVYMESYTVQQRFGYHPELAMAQGDLKLMATPSARMHDLAADPRERENVAPQHPEVEALLRQTLDEVLAAAVADAGGAVAPEMAEQLAALGYVVVGGVDTQGFSEIDAKDRLDTIHSVEQARRLAMTPKALDKAIAAYRKVIEQEPQIVEARLGLARALQRQREFEQAETVLRQALDLDASSTVLRLNLATCLTMQGRYEEGLAEAEAVLALVPTETGARVSVVRDLAALGRGEEALSRVAAWAKQGPLEAALQAETGLLLARMGDLKAAHPHLEQSLRDDVPRPYVKIMLSRVASSQGDKDQAMTWLRGELDAFPSQREARWVLGNMLMETSRWDEAAAEYRFLAEADASDFVARRAWAQAVFNTGDYSQADTILAPALDIAPDDPDALLLYANVLTKLGKHEEAKNAFEQGRAIKAAQIEQQAVGN